MAAALGVHWNKESVFPDLWKNGNHKPDALILGYPVITSGVYTHKGSMERLTGTCGWDDFFSLEMHVGEHVPPTFLWHTADDEIVPVQNSLLFFDALLEKKVPAELHIYPKGVHGLSLATEEVQELEKMRVPDRHVAGWFSQCLGWLDWVLGGKTVL